MKTITETMQAMVITGYGDTSVFKQMEMPKPDLKSADTLHATRLLLVKVHAASINPVDCKIRKGQIPTGIKPPQILGFDVSGVVVETLGTGTSNFTAGDEVYYLPRIIGSQGAYAEYHLVEESIVSFKPKNISHIEAASIPLVASTAYDALFERVKIRLGETILIHGGAGGVGSVAIQLAKLCGCYVFSTCSEKNIDFVKSLGADYVINYKKEDFVDVILKETKGEGVNIVFDTVGGETFSKSLDIIRTFGRITSIVRMPTNLDKAYFKNIVIHPVFVQSGRLKLDLMRDLIERGQLKPQIDSVISLKEIPKAHERLEKGGVRGKIVIDVAKK